MRDEYRIKLKCVFCGNEEFVLPADNYELGVGTQIKCARCGKLNTYEVLKDLSIKEGINLVTTDLTKEIKEIMTKAGFKRG